MRRDRWLRPEFLMDGHLRWVRWRCAHGHWRMVDRLELQRLQKADDSYQPTCLEGHVVRPAGGPEVVT